MAGDPYCNEWEPNILRHKHMLQYHINGLAQDCGNCIFYALDVQQSWAEPSMHTWYNSTCMEGLTKKRRNSIANTLELHLFCIKPYVCHATAPLLVLLGIHRNPYEEKLLFRLMIYSHFRSAVQTHLSSPHVIYSTTQAYPSWLLGRFMWNHNNHSKCVSLNIYFTGVLNWIVPCETSIIPWVTSKFSRPSQKKIIDN